MTGTFSDVDLLRNKRWFYGWFNALQSFYNFREGNRKKVLEIGCAIGAASRILAERGFIVDATDISPYAIQKASKVNIHPNLRFKILDIQSRKLSTNKIKYDLIIGFEVIEHLQDLDTTLANINALLNKGGVCICSTPFPYAYVFRDETHINVRHPLDWKKRFIKAGFKNIRVKQVGFVPYFYRFSEKLHIQLPFGLPTPYVNSPVFIYAEKA